MAKRLFTYLFVLFFLVVCFFVPFVFQKEVDWALKNVLNPVVEAGDSTRTYINGFFTEEEPNEQDAQ